jgi:hypothetical protein
MARSKGRGKRGLWRHFVLLAPVLSALAATGCGGSEERKSNPRPPATIEVSVEIGEQKVSADPAKLGAGPIVLVASNQSNASHQLTIDGPRLRQSVGPINPEDTATLKVSLRPGEYTVAADGTTAVRPAMLTVGPERTSAQNDLLQP